MKSLGVRQSGTGKVLTTCSLDDHSRPSSPSTTNSPAWEMMLSKQTIQCRCRSNCLSTFTINSKIIEPSKHPAHIGNRNSYAKTPYANWPSDGKVLFLCWTVFISDLVGSWSCRCQHPLHAVHEDRMKAFIDGPRWLKGFFIDEEQRNGWHLETLFFRARVFELRRVIWTENEAERIIALLRRHASRQIKVLDRAIARRQRASTKNNHDGSHARNSTGGK